MKLNSKLSLLATAYFFFFPLLSSYGEMFKEESDIEAYLNSIKTLQAELIQISSNGEVETGRLLIQKPGNLRFEYDPPAQHLVIASGHLFVVIDKKSTAEPQRYFTSQTPIGYLLEETVKLTHNPAVRSFLAENSDIHISIIDNNKLIAGELELIFSKNPTKLKEWTITNYSGEQTRVLLEKLIINKPINKILFDIGNEISKVRRQLRQN